MRFRLAALGLIAAALLPKPAQAVLDVEDRGPVLSVGNFRMRVTNAGILGNAFYNVGRSSDPSFEYPAYSGIELLNHAELWVGAIDAQGETRVSGAPMLEFRPTLDADDHVRIVSRGRPGTKRLVDDDGDGKIDEELLNGKDDDGDGEIDEDLGLAADQMAAADFVDDRPEAVNFGYPTGEPHVPLGLSVHQEAFAWGVPQLEGVAGLRFIVTNHTNTTLHQVYMGVLADLDARRAEDRPGHRNDEIENHAYEASKFEGAWLIRFQGQVHCGMPPPCPPIQCFTDLAGSAPVLHDGGTDAGLGAIALMPLDHSVDPLARYFPTLAKAPLSLHFRTSIFDGEGIPGEGGPPQLDVDHYAALAGRYRNATPNRPGDWQVLLSCGPFFKLDPGQSIEFTAALVAAPTADSVESQMSRVLLMHHGFLADLQPNVTSRPEFPDSYEGPTGVAGHDACIQPPVGQELFIDPDCNSKWSEPEAPVMDSPILYPHDRCIWTDTDCSNCTGLNGMETRVPWLDPGDVAPGPGMRVVPGDRKITVEWDNFPEVLLASHQIGGTKGAFIGYRLYKLAQWRDRESLLPPRRNWALVATYGAETGNGEVPLSSITDSSIDYERMLYDQKLYPIGRYRYVDREVLNGFDYVYLVTTLHVTTFPIDVGVIGTFTVETPLMAKFEDRVSPQAAAAPAGDQVTVVPNPFRRRADWDRRPVFGDPLPRHIDFMHLPKAKGTVRIYTLAGDLVDQLDFDGRAGDGEVSWDLISRNGQDVESGIYLFTVESPLGHQVGKFVVVR